MTEWCLDPDVAYLNHGAFGVVPRVVAAAAAEIRARVEADPANAMMRWLVVEQDEIRRRVAELLNADDAGLVFVPNATTGTATVLASVASSLQPGDEVLTTDHRYGAVGVQLDRLAADRGIVTTVAPVPLDIASSSDVVTAIVDRITPQTKLLVVDAIASASGFVFPVGAIVAAAHDRGVPVLVDAAHAPGQIEVDLAATGADFWVGNLHKWVNCLRGLGVLHVSPRWRDAVRPLVASHHFAEGYRQAFDWTGTADPVPLLSVPAALDYWEKLGWEQVRRTQRDLVDDGAALIAAALQTRVPVRDEFRAAMRVVDLPRSLSADTARRIEDRLSAEHRIEVSLMQLADTSLVRVCAQVYNTADDYTRLADALPSLLADS
jgi:isopenicillin-N epimerase